MKYTAKLTQTMFLALGAAVAGLSPEALAQSGAPASEPQIQPKFLALMSAISDYVVSSDAGGRSGALRGQRGGALGLGFDRRAKRKKTSDRSTLDLSDCEQAQLWFFPVGNKPNPDKIVITMSDPGGGESTSKTVFWYYNARKYVQDVDVPFLSETMTLELDIDASAMGCAPSFSYALACLEQGDDGATTYHEKEGTRRKVVAKRGSDDDCLGNQAIELYIEDIAGQNTGGDDVLDPELILRNVQRYCSISQDSFQCLEGLFPTTSVGR